MNRLRPILVYVPLLIIVLASGMVTPKAAINHGLRTATEKVTDQPRAKANPATPSNMMRAGKTTDPWQMTLADYRSARKGLPLGLKAKPNVSQDGIPDCSQFALLSTSESFSWDTVTDPNTPPNERPSYFVKTECLVWTPEATGDSSGWIKADANPVLQPPDPGDPPNIKKFKVTYSILKKNEEAEEKTRVIKIKVGLNNIEGADFNVIQGPAPCFLDVTANGLTVGNGTPLPVTPFRGGSVSGEVTTRTPCRWTASVEPGGEWLGASNSWTGEGNGSFTVTVPENPFPVPRDATITVRMANNPDKSFVIKQEKHLCIYTINQTAVPIPYSGTSGNFAVTVDANCPWTPVVDVSWVALSIATTTTGAKTVVYTVDENPPNSPARSATITVEDKTLVLNQALSPPLPPDCEFTVTPTQVPEFAGTGGNGSFLITTSKIDCPWVATITTDPPTPAGQQPWVRLSRTNGERTTTVTYTVDSNPDALIRSATITVRGKTHKLSQARGNANTPPSCTPVLTPSSSPRFSPAGGSGMFAVSIGARCSWTAAPNAASTWIQITSQNQETGRVEYTVDANPKGNTSRTGRILVEGEAYTITQDALSTCSFTLIPNKSSIGELGGGTEERGFFGFTVDTTNDCRWAAKSNTPLKLKLIDANARSQDEITGTGKGVVTYSVEPNTETAEKTYEIQVEDQTFKVTQAAKGPCSTNPKTTPQPRPIEEFGKAIYGRITDDDCPAAQKGTAFRADRYIFTLPTSQKVAINLSSSFIGFDPVIALLQVNPVTGKETEIDTDDDGAGFRNVRLPKESPEKEVFKLRAAGTYIVEVRSFQTNKSGVYGLLVSTEDTYSTKPTILGIVEDKKTLIVTGENFQKAKLFMVDLKDRPEGVPFKNPTIDPAKPTTALIVLNGVSQIKQRKDEMTIVTQAELTECIKLQVENMGGVRSDVFIYCRTSK